MLTVAQAAEKLGVKPGLIYSLCTGRRLRHVRLGNGRGVLRIPEEALEEYVRSVTVNAQTGTAPSPAPARRGVKLKHLRL